MNLPNRPTAAAARLAGQTLANGWSVEKLLPRNPNATGGTFSHSYIVKNGEKTGFLKAFDFSPAIEPGADTIEILRILILAYEHERAILSICKERRLSKVVIALDSGNVQLPGENGLEERVFYLIFELADGDIRGQVDESRKFDTLWTMRALKDVCLGLWQIHKEMIAHQDVKPSNVLLFGEGFRIGDFGRSSQKGRAVYYDEFACAGDRNYSPPELLYGFAHPEFNVRRIGCDLYMLGNLMAFMFGGINVTAGILSYLDLQFHWQNWEGKYQEVLPYLQEAFTRVLEDLSTQIDADLRADIVPMIRELCNPSIEKRGHPRGIGRPNQYSLERYVSHLDYLSQQFEMRLSIRKRKAG